MGGRGGGGGHHLDADELHERSMVAHAVDADVVEHSEVIPAKT
jgi:hypothetical protein